MIGDLSVLTVAYPLGAAYGDRELRWFLRPRCDPETRTVAALKVHISRPGYATCGNDAYQDDAKIIGRTS
jgi:hypothetical protein